MAVVDAFCQVKHDGHYSCFLADLSLDPLVFFTLRILDVRKVPMRMMASTAHGVL